MSVDAIAAVALQNASSSLAAATLQAAPGAAPTLPGVSAPNAVFETLVGEFEQLNARMSQSRAASESVALGDLDNLHQVMMTAEHTRLSFELALQVRNKVLEAYQELMRQQV